MVKYFEVKIDKRIDRYKLIHISIDDFLDTFVNVLLNENIEFKEISLDTYEKDKKFELQMNVENKFQVEHYIYQHESKEARNDWNRFIRQQRRIETLNQGLA